MSRKKIITIGALAVLLLAAGAVNAQMGWNADTMQQGTSWLPWYMNDVRGYGPMGGSMMGQNMMGQNMMGQNMMGQNMMGQNMMGQNMMGQNMMGQGYNTMTNGQYASNVADENDRTYINGMMQGNNGMMQGGMFANHLCSQSMGNYPGNYNTNVTPLTLAEATDAVEQYLDSTGNSDLKLSEIMEFDNHFYASVEEESTGIHAFEVLINKYTGTITPEMGPNMMWNTKYGHMSYGTQTQTTITEEQALAFAQEFLDKTLPGYTADDIDTFYGYYTMHVLDGDEIYGMLSVNAYTGDVWYHNWHGKFVQMVEAQ